MAKYLRRSFKRKKEVRFMGECTLSAGGPVIRAARRLCMRTGECETGFGGHGAR